MIVLFDTSTLTFLFKPDAPGPFIDGTGERVSDCGERISFLLAELQKAKATIIIPTPVIAEIMVLAGTAMAEWHRILTTSRHFRSAPFDVLAAVECAEMAKRRLGARMSRAEKAKAKFDEQIVAIGRAEGAEIIYSDDGGIRELAGEGVKVLGMADMPLPPSEAQRSFDLEMAAPQPSPEADEE